MATGRTNHSTEILKKCYEEVKLRNPRFSLRSFAQRLGLSSGALSEILVGKRPLTMKMKLKIVERLALSPMDKKQFLSEEIAHHISQRQRKYHQLSEDHFRLISDWWHYAILNLIHTQDFQPKVSWMSKRLNLKPSLVSEAWKRLIRMKFIIKDKSGKYKRNTVSLNTTEDMVSLSIRKSHIQDLALIEKAILEKPIDARHTSSMTFSMRVKNMDKAKKLIEKWEEEISDNVETNDGDEVYRLSISLFPLTHKI